MCFAYGACRRPLNAGNEPKWGGLFKEIRPAEDNEIMKATLKSMLLYRPDPG
jgi:hypothetical protein